MTTEKHLSERAFAKHRAPTVAENIKRNLAWLHRLQVVAPSEEQGSVTVVGAGPSLTTLPAGPLLVCNTAAPRVLRERGGGVGVVVREALDVSEQLRGAHRPDYVVCDLACHGRIIETAVELVGQERVFIAIAGQMELFATTALLHVEPLYAGSAALTLAVALAERWGAYSTHLAGVDLAYAGDRVYADGTPYEAERATLQNGHAFLAGTEAHHAVHARTNHVAPPNAPSVWEVPAQDGGVCHATGAWADQLSWLEEFARRRPDALLDRGQGTAAIAGWDRIDAPVGGSFSPAGRMVDASACEAEIERQLAHAARLCADGPLHERCPDLLAGCGLVEFHAAGSLFALGDLRAAKQVSDGESIDAAYQIIARHAAKLAAA